MQSHARSECSRLSQAPCEGVRSPCSCARAPLPHVVRDALGSPAPHSCMGGPLGSGDEGPPLRGSCRQVAQCSQPCDTQAWQPTHMQSLAAGLHPMHACPWDAAGPTRASTENKERLHFSLHQFDYPESVGPAPPPQQLSAFHAADAPYPLGGG